MKKNTKSFYLTLAFLPKGRDASLIRIKIKIKKTYVPKGRKILVG